MNKTVLIEKDFIDKMIEIAKDGYEYSEQLKHVFFTWAEFFNIESDSPEADTVIEIICKAYGCDSVDDEIESMLLSVLSDDEEYFDEDEEYFDEDEIEYSEEYLKEYDELYNKFNTPEFRQECFDMAKKQFPNNSDTMTKCMTSLIATRRLEEKISTAMRIRRLKNNKKDK